VHLGSLLHGSSRPSVVGNHDQQTSSHSTHPPIQLCTLA
jgi:hypothetical protein